jgi:hypothetical protein
MLSGFDGCSSLLPHGPLPSPEIVATWRRALYRQVSLNPVGKPLRRCRQGPTSLREGHCGRAPAPQNGSQACGLPSSIWRTRRASASGVKGF